MVKNQKVKIFFISIFTLIILLYIFIVNIDFFKEKYLSVLFELPTIKGKINSQKDIAVKQQRKHEGFVKYYIDNFTDYRINYYNLPLKNYFENGDKPTAYIETYKDKIIISSGDGKILFSKLTNFSDTKINYTKISNNLKDIIDDELFFKPGSRSIKDSLVHEDFIYLTYTKRVKKDCYNISVLRSKINFDYLEFGEIFSPDECLKDNYRKQSGGRIHPYKDNQFILTVGSFAHDTYAQKDDNMFGKIITFSAGDNDYEILSKGHRNPQGLFYDFASNVIINTEHGALGGDEININKLNEKEYIKNYGWPISSYGVHYGRVIIEESPLHKSHSEYGFIEPIKYFNPAIGISQIIIQDESENEYKDFLVTSLGHGVNEGGDMSIHFIKFDQNYESVISHSLIPVGERIRDIVRVKDDSYLMVLESAPVLAIINKKDKICRKNKPPCDFSQTYEKTIYKDGIRIGNERLNYNSLMP